MPGSCRGSDLVFRWRARAVQRRRSRAPALSANRGGRTHSPGSVFPSLVWLSLRVGKVANQYANEGIDRKENRIRDLRVSARFEDLTDVPPRLISSFGAGQSAGHKSHTLRLRHMRWL